MGTGKLELKILTDLDGENIKLENMSIAAAKSLKTFLESLINIVELTYTNGTNDINIQILKGSACVVAEGPESKISKLENGFNEVAGFLSTNKILVDSWREIQKVINNNGLEYEVNFYNSSKQKKEVTDKLKIKNTFKVKQKRKKADTELFFLKGKLIAVGGLKPNFHIYNEGEEEIIVHCDEQSAQKVNTFLYNEILISAWRKQSVNDKPSYIFCDIYINENIFDEFKKFNKSLNSYDIDSEIFLAIHDKVKSIVANEGLGKLKKFMRLFNHNSISVCALKALLVVTKAFKYEEEIKDIRNSINEILEKKLRLNIK